MRLGLCFLWHMHQPYYKDPETGTYILPWVRLHAIKDYVALPRIFRRYEGVRHTFNLVPSLLIQVRDYVENGAEDIFLTVSKKNALDLTREEEEFLLRNFFSAFAPTMILPQPRFAELYRRRDAALHALKGNGTPGGFGASEYTDLAALFNLTWFHPIHRQEDPELERLWAKGSHFTEREKQYVLDRQIDVMGQMFEEYRRLAGDGGNELSSSPMYHPILPLLIDNRSALDAQPGTSLPHLPFAYPRDARRQLERGKGVFRELFGADPAGLWPSEGSISPATLDLAAASGFRWGATDEILLSKAFGKPIVRDSEGVPADARWFYHPYTANTPAGPIRMFFRDHHLSDLIGFEYSRWDPNDAVNHFIHKLKMIYDKLSSDTSVPSGDDFFIPVILDGENAWEYFPDSGTQFLTLLLEKLNSLRPQIECMTLSEALDRARDTRELPSIPTGSWIDGTFQIWIGHREDHAAWEMLARARALWETGSKEHQGTNLPPEWAEAEERLLVAEGSDWCWWYGDDHFTPHGPEFDRLFRHNVKAAYLAMGIEPPDAVDLPIIRPERISSGENTIAAPRSYLRPKIDGVNTSYFEWSSAAVYHPNPEFGAMHRAGHTFLSCFYYGFDEDNIYLRIDLDPQAIENTGDLTVEILFPAKGRKLRIELDLKTGGCTSVFRGISDSGEEGAAARTAPEGEARVAFRRILEIALPVDAIGCREEQRLDFFLTIQSPGTIGERWPVYGTFSAELPGDDYEDRMWEV